ncbi:hypothetical protein ACKKBF_B15395 [Auxenochlorella protothecoides x Auxenochlorella symbiontica]
MKSRTILALKHFRLGGDPGAVAAVYNEIGIMDELRECPAALSLVAAEFGPGNQEAFVLLEFCQHNLATHLQSLSRPMDLEGILAVFQPVCVAVEALHSLQLPTVHRDIKAENVLLHSNGQWVLCDFGSATTCQMACRTGADIALLEDEIQRNTTPAYRAPEMWDLYAREFIGTKVDIWALGCLFYLLCFGRLPFEGEAKLQILNGRYEIPPGTPASIRELLEGMLTINVARRWDIGQVQERISALSRSSAVELGPVEQHASAPAGATHSRPSSRAASQWAPSASATQSQQQQARVVSDTSLPRGPLAAQAAALAATPTSAAAMQAATAFAPSSASVSSTNTGLEHRCQPSDWATGFEEIQPVRMPSTANAQSADWATFGSEAFLPVDPVKTSPSPPRAPAGADQRDSGQPGFHQSFGQEPSSSAHIMEEPPTGSIGGHSQHSEGLLTQSVDPLTTELSAALSRITDLEETCGALEHLFKDKVKEVETLKARLANQDQQLEALRLQILESKETSQGDNSQTLLSTLSLHENKPRTESSTHSRNTSDPPSGASSPSKLCRPVARSFTTGMNGGAQNYSSPMRVPTGPISLSKPVAQPMHGRNLSQPSCFEQLDPLG